MTEALHHIAYTARRFKASTALNFTGLVAAFAVCYLLLTQVVFQAQYNHGIKDHERIYRLESTFFSNQDSEWGSSGARFMSEDLAAMPEVEGVTMIEYAWKHYPMKFKQGDKEVEFPGLISNNTAVSNLTDKVVDGSIEWNDTDREGVIIPASIAKQYFGTTHAAGKIMYRITRDSIKPITVRGVYQDFPENSTPCNAIMENVGDLYANTIGNLRFTYLVKFKEGVEDVNSLIEPMKQRFAETSRRFFADENDDELRDWLEDIQNTKYQFRPLDDIYFSHIDDSDLGNRSALSIIELIVLLIIIVATVNTFNYTLAISPMWVRDTNTRMVMGATRSSIRLRLIAESVITTVAACLLALAVCQALSMTAATNKLFDGDISVIAHPGIVLTTLAIAVVIGVLSSVYPAHFVTSIQTATALKSSFGLPPEGTRLRTGLIGLQLIITMFLVSFICTLYQQTHFIFNSDYGFDFDRILHVRLNRQNPDYREYLRADLKLLPGVENVAYSHSIIGSFDYYWSCTTQDPNDTTKTIYYYLFHVDEDYLSTMGIQIVKGQGLKSTDKNKERYVINEAMNALFSNDGKAKTIKIEGEVMNVVGVCNNVRYGTTRKDKNTPIAFVFDPNKSYLCWILNVRIAEDADRAALKTAIAQLIKKHSGHESGQIMDMETTLADSYSNEFRFVKLVSLFSVICMIIMLVGVFCLTMLETEYHRKEIAIRKVAGATSREIIGMLCKRYCWLILACFVIAMPIAYSISNLWLNTFAEHQPIRWWPFPFSLLVVGGLTLGTILLQCWHTAHENPVNSIKTE